MSKFVKFFSTRRDRIILVLILVVALLSIVGAVLLKPSAGSAPLIASLHQTKVTTLFLAGDIMLSRNVDRKMSTAQDFTLPFISTQNQTQTADISFANLESPFLNHGAHFVDGSLIFNADPQAVSGLSSAGFDILSTANNHTLDQGAEGLNFTYNLLKQNNILPI